MGSGRTHLKHRENVSGHTDAILLSKLCCRGAQAGWMLLLTAGLAWTTKPISRGIGPFQGHCGGASPAVLVTETSSSCKWGSGRY